MGVSVYVESIIMPQSRRKEFNGPFVAQNEQRQVWLNAITEHFAWEKSPWEEPSEKRGLNTSMGNGRYSILLSLAWAVESLGDQNPDLLHTVEYTRRSPSEYQYPELRNTCKNFPHLLDRNIITSIYLPIDFPTPIHFDLEPEWPGYGPSIASSVRLKDELHLLFPVLDNIVATRGRTTQVPSYPPYTWDSVYDGWSILTDATLDSLNLNLPLFIRW